MRTTQFLTRSTFAFAFALFIVQSCGCNPASHDQSVIASAEQFNTALQPAEIQQPDLNSYLQTIGGRIVAAAKESDARGYGPKSHKGKDDWMYQNIEFRLVNSKTLNAFTTGGHFVYIYNELFQLCQNEDELAAVMAHEFGHIYARHVQKGSNRQTVLAAA